MSEPRVSQQSNRRMRRHLAGRHLDDLIDALVRRELHVVFLGHGPWDEPATVSANRTADGRRGACLPPIKWRPLKCLTKGLGALRLTRTPGRNELPMPDFGGPSSTCHDDGTSTEVTGSLVRSSAWITDGKGSRT